MPKGNNKNELGCTNPITGVKSKCIIRIVPKIVENVHLKWILNVKPEDLKKLVSSKK